MLKRHQFKTPYAVTVLVARTLLLPSLSSSAIKFVVAVTASELAMYVVKA